MLWFFFFSPLTDDFELKLGPLDHALQSGLAGVVAAVLWGYAPEHKLDALTVGAALDVDPARDMFIH